MASVYYTTSNQNTISGVTNRYSNSFSTDQAAVIGEDLAHLGKAGTLTTRTTASSGTMTLSTGHGITTAAVVSLFFLSGTSLVYRYGVVIGSVSGNSVPFSAGDGSDLPAASSAITVCLLTKIEGYNIDTSKIRNMSFGTNNSNAVLYEIFDDSDTLQKVFLIEGANDSLLWDDGNHFLSIFDNPFLLKSIKVSTNSTTGTVSSIGGIGTTG